jgi:hypothetical protein
LEERRRFRLGQDELDERRGVEVDAPRSQLDLVLPKRLERLRNRPFPGRRHTDRGEVSAWSLSQPALPRELRDESSFDEGHEPGDGTPSLGDVEALARFDAAKVLAQVLPKLTDADALTHVHKRSTSARRDAT